MQYGTHENIAKNLIFIDGLTRSGKSVFSGIIPSLESVEQIQFFNLIEQVVPAVGLGTVDLEYARALLRASMNELAYNIRLGRGVNFRPGDQTGVFNYVDPALYVGRLTRDEGSEVIEELRSSERALPFQTHDMMVNLDTLEALDIDYRMIELYRHPVDNVYSWWTRGWGERFIDDPQCFTLSLAHEGTLVPWYCAGYEEEWLELNPKERCHRTALDLISRSVTQQKNARRPDRIHTVTFEDFVQHPDEELGEICEFLGLRPSKRTWEFVRAARCPRELDRAERERKRRELQASVDPVLSDELDQVSEQYEADLYGLRA